MALLRTPFFDTHANAKARMVDFAGWEMPLHYGSIIEEHHQCRTSGAMFDVSHMGRLHIKGRHARKFLERVVTRKVSDMVIGQCRYALVCNEKGGVMDDVLVYKFEDKWMVVCNASNRAKIVAHFNAVIQGEKHTVEMDDVTESTAMLAFQGPKVMEQVSKVSSTIPLLKNYHFTEKNLMIVKLVVSRTGYTGEDGVEVILGAKTAKFAYDLLMGKGDAGMIKPAGLGARDTLRIEAGMPLYGHELGEEIDPLSAGLKFGVTLGKENGSDAQVEIPRFIGQDALEAIAQNGVPQTLIGLKMDGRRTPRQGAEVLVNGQPSGTVTSGCMSPTLNVPIAMAFVKPNLVKAGDTVEIAFGASKETAKVCALPFYKRAK